MFVGVLFVTRFGGPNCDIRAEGFYERRVFGGLGLALWFEMSSGDVDCGFGG